MKLLKLSLMIAMVAFLGSCQLAKFDRVPGESLGNIPVELHGRYAMVSKDLKGFFGSDSVILEIENTSIHVKSNSLNFSKIHDQDFRMVRFRGYDMFAFTDPTIPALWNLIIIENYKGSIRLYPILDKRVNADEAGKMGQFLPQQLLNINCDPVQTKDYLQRLIILT